MIGQSVLLALGTAIFFGSVIVCVLAVGLRVPHAVWILVPAAIGGLVAVFEWMRIKRTPLDRERPGIVPGDE